MLTTGEKGMPGEGGACPLDTLLVPLAGACPWLVPVLSLLSI